MTYPKALILFHRSRGDSLRNTMACPHTLANSRLAFKSRVFYHGGHFQSDGNRWYDLILEVSQDLFWSFPWFFLHHPNYSSVQPWVSFPLVAMSREVGYSPMDFKHYDISSRGCRNMFFSDGFLAFSFTILGYLLPFLLSCLLFFLLSIFTVLHPVTQNTWLSTSVR